MPTIQGIDSFQHRILPVAINSTRGWYSSVNGGGTLPNHGSSLITFDTGTKRTADHACSLKFVSDGAATLNVRRTIASKVVVGSIYFNCTAIGSGAKLVNMGLSAGVASVALTSSGFIQLKVGSGTAQTGAVNFADGAWHRLDWYADTTTGTATIDAEVDGAAQTQATLSLATADMTNIIVYDNTVVVNGNVIYFQDLVWSVTAGDYPLGDHICMKLEINAGGTISGAATFTDQAGTNSDAARLAAVDDAWDGTTPELSQTGEDYVRQTAIGSTSYVEFGTANPIESTVWGAQLGILMAAEDSTTSDNCEGRLVDSGGATLASTTLIDPSVSATAYNAYRVYATAAPSGGWSGATLSGCLIRWGFSTDVTPNPIMNSAIVEYVAPWSASPAAQTLDRKTFNPVPFYPTPTQRR